MADSAVTKRELLEMTCMILGSIMQPAMLVEPVVAAAKKLNIPDASELVAELLKVPKGTAAEEDGKGKKQKKKKDDSEKKPRKPSWWNIAVTVFLDYTTHYGKNPKVIKLKETAEEAAKANPNGRAASGMSVASSYLKALPAETQTEIEENVRAFLGSVPDDDTNQDRYGLAAVSAWEAAHPARRPLLKLMGLEKKDEWKTDPAQIKADAAAARKAGGATPGNGARAASAAAQAPAAAAAQDESEEDEDESGDEEEDEDEEPPAKAQQESEESEEDEDEDESSEEEAKAPPPPKAPAVTPKAAKKAAAAAVPAPAPAPVLVAAPAPVAPTPTGGDKSAKKKRKGEGKEEAGSSKKKKEEHEDKKKDKKEKKEGKKEKKDKKSKE